jgi:MFS family permease
MTASVRRRRSSPRRRGLRLAFYEGGLANVFTELTGGQFQVGFALLLGARDLQIGLLSALPHLANLSQLTASYLLERTGQCKRLALLTSGLSRLVWVGVLLLPLGLFSTLGDLRVWFLVSIVALSSLFVAMNNTVWISWLGDLVPRRLRGRYFGRRNMLIAAVSMSVPLLAGVLIDAWKNWFSPQDARGFLLIFCVGIGCGVAALAVLWRIPAMPFTPSQGSPFFSRLAVPLRDTNFRRFILFYLCWGASVNIAGPFFVVFMLQELRFSYTLVAILTATTALCSIIGMRFWGQMTDRFSAKPVSLLGGIGAASLPGLWLLTAVLPPWGVLAFSHIVGGLSWSALNLNLNTLLLGLSPRQERSIYLSVYASLTGLTTAVAPIVGGLLGKMLREGTVPLPLWANPYLCLFALSCVCRMLSLLLFRRVREPREVPLERLLLVFGNLRTLNTMMGFDALFHYGYMQGERLDRFIVSRSRTIRQALEHLDDTTDVYASRAEAQVQQVVQAGEEVLEAVEEQRAQLEKRLDTYVERSETRVSRWVGQLSALLRRWQQRLPWGQ